MSIFIPFSTKGKKIAMFFMKTMKDLFKIASPNDIE